MNKFPLDRIGLSDTVNVFIKHCDAQEKLIAKLADYLSLAMHCVDLEDAYDEDVEWYKNANKLLTQLKQRTADFDNLRFDQKNGHKKEILSPYNLEHDSSHETPKTDGELSVEELAKYFGESIPAQKKGKKLSKMTDEEIVEWEKKQDNSNDIYKIAARMKNLARESINANLTPQGEMIVNTFVHSIKLFYDFAETIEDKDVKIKLIGLVKSQEEMPANLISALFVKVKE